MPPETPLAFGLHPNAEIGFKLREAETFCNSLVQLQPREAGGEGGLSSEEKAKMVLDDVMERLPELFDMEEVRCLLPLCCWRDALRGLACDAVVCCVPVCMSAVEPGQLQQLPALAGSPAECDICRDALAG